MSTPSVRFAGAGGDGAASSSACAERAAKGDRGRRYPWAELLRRVFLVDVLVCPHCRGVRRLLAAIHDPASIERVLRAMGLPTVAPALAAARSPPVQADLPR